MNPLFEQDLNAFKDSTYNEKNSIVVTSDGSLYGDSLWKYYGEVEQRNVKKSQATINWEINFGQGKYFSDSLYTNLLETSKDFIYSLRISETRRGRAPKATTVLKTYKSLIPLLKWMIDKDILNFSLLNSEMIMEYLTFQRMFISRFGKSLSTGEIFKRIDVIEQIWRQSEYISNSLQENPFPNETPYKLSGITKIKQFEQKYDFIPDEVAIALGTIAVNYVDKKSKYIIEAYKASQIAYCRAMKEYSKAAANRHARKAVNSFGYKYVKDVTKDVGYLRTACYIVIALFSGIRDSEISSLDIDCSEVDSETGYSWIRGYVYKTADQKIKSRWMVPPVVKKAVGVIEKLTDNFRIELLKNICDLKFDLEAPLTSGEKKNKLTIKLIEIEKIKNALWLVRSSKLGNEISSNKTIHQQLLEFTKAHEIPNYEGKPWSIHPHQFRRTFVRFMVKNSMNLKYLQEHFRHISLDMTAWYDIEDTELTKDIINCYTEMTKEKLVQIVDSNAIAGKGGQIIIDKRDDYFQGVIGKSKEHIIKAMADTVTLRSTGVSWCLGDVESGECSGVHGCMIDPSNVNICSQAIVTSEFLPAWREIEIRNQELLKRDDLGGHQKLAISNFLKTVVSPVIRDLEK